MTIFAKKSILILWKKRDEPCRRPVDSIQSNFETTDIDLGKWGILNQKILDRGRETIELLSSNISDHYWCIELLVILF